MDCDAKMSLVPPPFSYWVFMLWLVFATYWLCDIREGMHEGNIVGISGRGRGVINYC